MVGAAVLLASCQNLPQKTAAPAQSWETRRAQLQQRDAFDFKARVAVAAGQEGFNARLRWKQQGSQSQLALDGPLGVGGAQIVFDGQSLNVHTSRGQQLNDEAARAELLARLGFEPPLQSLRYWIQGVPDPASPAEESLDEEQRLAALKQSDWQVDFDAYTAASGAWLPERLTMRREGVRVRVRIDEWSR